MRRSSVTIRLRPSGIGARHSSRFQIRRFRRQPLQQAGTKPLRLAGLWLPSRPVSGLGEKHGRCRCGRPEGAASVRHAARRAAGDRRGYGPRRTGRDLWIRSSHPARVNPFARYPRVIGHDSPASSRRWAMGSQTSLSARRRSSIRSSHAVIATRAGSAAPTCAPTSRSLGCTGTEDFGSASTCRP